MNEIPLYNERTVQSAVGGMTQRQQEKLARDYGHLAELGPGVVQGVVDRWNTIVRNGTRAEVEEVRAEARARGVQVVVDEDLPYSFVREELPDE
jgi:hypothetical protein